MSAWAVSDALEWLEWSRRLDPEDGETDLMRAICFRRLGQKGRWGKAMQSARKKGTPFQQIQQESSVALIQSGEAPKEAERQLIALIEAGVPQQDAVASFVHGCLARDEAQRAKGMLDAWTADAPDDAHNAYVRGVYWSHLNEASKAMAAFENALAKEPRHELSHTAIAERHEEMGRLDRAIESFADSATRFPGSETARIGLARGLRKMVRVDEARAVLAICASREDISSSVAIEMGHIELVSGNYQKSERWFARAHSADLTPHDILTAGVATALAGRPGRADRLFALVKDNKYASAVSQDLQVRLVIEPKNREAADELERLRGSSLSKSALAERIEKELDELGESARPPTSPTELYTLHCGACHGANGDASGLAALYLFPKPCDLRRGRFRLVSTHNAVPTQEDVETVIRRGMPGTSMSSFEDLNEDHQKLLAEEVLRIRREGIREEFVNMLKREGEEIDTQEVDSVVEHLTKPGEVVRAPRFGPADAQAIEEGRELYFSQNCDSCHGKDGRGEAKLLLFDDERFPTRARDLAHESFKGGHEPEEIYRRISVGMPGTPHAASKNLSDEQLIDLVHYVRSLSQEPKRALSNHQRAIQATGRAYLTAVRGSPGEE